MRLKTRYDVGNLPHAEHPNPHVQLGVVGDARPHGDEQHEQYEQNDQSQQP
jgi:hypothetical protein